MLELNELTLADGEFVTIDRDRRDAHGRVLVRRVGPTGIAEAYVDPAELAFVDLNMGATWPVVDADGHETTWSLATVIGAGGTLRRH